MEIEPKLTLSVHKHKPGKHEERVQVELFPAIVLVGETFVVSQHPEEEQTDGTKKCSLCEKPKEEIEALGTGAWPGPFTSRVDIVVVLVVVLGVWSLVIDRHRG